MIFLILFYVHHSKMYDWIIIINCTKTQQKTVKSHVFAKYTVMSDV